MAWSCNPIPHKVPITDDKGTSLEKTSKRKLRGNCANGQLTTLGEAQMEHIGKLFRRHYVEELRFLPSEWTPSVGTIRVTHVDRTLVSARSFLKGLYPQNRGLFTDYKIYAGTCDINNRYSQ